MAKKIETIDALIFIDTNIFLDFYRIRKSDISMKYLEQIENHLDLIITTSQVEMEYKKNRQSVILESIDEIKKIGTVTGNIPAILSNTKAVEMISKSRKEIQTKKKNLKDKIEKILKNPVYNDLVYKSLQKLFRNKSEINLNRENKKRFKTRNLAKKRFLLGYPPRKKSDNSIGDALNWEWIITCALETGKHIILVTRDNDFGCTYEKEPYLNDWLLQEFKQRTSRQRKIILTDKLSKAFQLVKIPVTQEMIEEENKVINLSLENYSNSRLFESINNINTTDWMLSIKKTQEIMDKLKFNIDRDEKE